MDEMLVVLNDIAGVNEDYESMVMQVDDDAAQHDELKDLFSKLQMALHPGLPSHTLSHFLLSFLIPLIPAALPSLSLSPTRRFLLPLTATVALSSQQLHRPPPLYPYPVTFTTTLPSFSFSRRHHRRPLLPASSSPSLLSLSPAAAAALSSQQDRLEKDVTLLFLRKCQYFNLKRSLKANTVVLLMRCEIEELRKLVRGLCAKKDMEPSVDQENMSTVDQHNGFKLLVAIRRAWMESFPTDTVHGIPLGEGNSNAQTQQLQLMIDNWGDMHHHGPNWVNPQAEQTFKLMKGDKATQMSQSASSSSSSTVQEDCNDLTF
ncbi:hypothetical protein TIFTF001_041669 [Ficus carica]|uniref:Uncharacterized protein n=1 Tax=Ficus carica TaxID=3494 RepID=A0AA87ZF81_FICCA|nr:hypothetical protein TIFTF001_041669 [Ficus carica]